MLIALTGFMGSGKSTVGRMLSDTLGCPFLDLDAVIEKQERRTIPDIFREEGEPAFRRLEQRALEDTVGRYADSTLVLALGGGTVTLPGAVALLQAKTLCIYLKAAPETLLEHLQGQTAGRPLATGDLRSLLEQREPLYSAAAHVSLETDGVSPEALTDEIIISCL